MQQSIHAIQYGYGLMEGINPGWKMFTSMQMVLTLQFSAALELTNDNG